MLMTSMEMWTEAAGKAQERCAATLTHLTLGDDSTTYSTHISIQPTLTLVTQVFPYLQDKIENCQLLQIRTSDSK